MALTPVSASAVFTFPFNFALAVDLRNNEWETVMLFVLMVVESLARLAWTAVVIRAVRFFLRTVAFELSLVFWCVLSSLVELSRIKSTGFTGEGTDATSGMGRLLFPPDEVQVVHYFYQWWYDRRTPSSSHMFFVWFQ